MLINAWFIFPHTQRIKTSEIKKWNKNKKNKQNSLNES